MNSVLSNQSNVSVQLSLFDAIKDLLFVHPVFVLGIIAICIILIIVFRKNKKIPKTKIWILSLALFVFYYYLYIMLTKIVGIPTLKEYIRLSGLGESFYHPNINLIPFSEGVSLGFVFNIFLFIPLGFLCPIISKSYQHVKKCIFYRLWIICFYRSCSVIYFI